MQVKELTGALLDYWVAMADGWKCRYGIPIRPTEHGPACEVWVELESSHPYWVEFRPTTNWLHAGPYIQDEKIELKWLDATDSQPAQWYAYVHALPDRVAYGETPLIAAMRAYVLAEYGNEVDDLQAKTAE
jgi:hypothetical protein